MPAGCGNSLPPIVRTAQTSSPGHRHAILTATSGHPFRRVHRNESVSYLLRLIQSSRGDSDSCPHGKSRNRWPARDSVRPPGLLCRRVSPARAVPLPCAVLATEARPVGRRNSVAPRLPERSFHHIESFSVLGEAGTDRRHSPGGREFAAFFGATARVITCQRPNCRIGIAPLLDPACPLPLPGVHREHAGRESLSRRQSRDERTTENYNRTRDNYLPARQVADGRPAGARQKLPGSRLGWST